MCENIPFEKSICRIGGTDRWRSLSRIGAEGQMNYADVAEQNANVSKDLTGEVAGYRKELRSLTSAAYRAEQR